MSLSLIHADTTPDKCKQDLSQTVTNYYKADNSNLKKKLLEAREAYQISLKSAYSALESCMSHEDYNFEMIYGFIQKNQEGLEATQN